MISSKFTCIIVPAILTAMRANNLDGSLSEGQVGVIDNKEQLNSQVLNGNPYLYPCTTNSECNNEFHICAKDGPNSTYWFCSCYCGGGPCRQNEDCCTNICDNGICASSGGTQGCICSGTTSECPAGEQCADGYVCQPWDKYGYCNSISQVSTSSSESPTTVLPTTTLSISDCPGYDCSTGNVPNNCSSNPYCYCFKTSTGEGFCSESFYCGQPDCSNCPSSTSVCIVESCCQTAQCVPLSLSAACTEPSTGIIHKSNKIFSPKRSNKTAAGNF